MAGVRALDYNDQAIRDRDTVQPPEKYKFASRSEREGRRNGCVPSEIGRCGDVIAMMMMMPCVCDSRR